MTRTVAPLLALLALAGCLHHAPPRAGLDLSLTRTTEAGRYVVELAPQQQPLPVNRIHTWQVVVRAADGAPVDGATIRVSGGMPEHGHGFPTQPRVSAQAEPGRYVLEGMKFSMTGWWEIRLDVQSRLGADRVTFNTVLPASAS